MKLEVSGEPFKGGSGAVTPVGARLKDEAGAQQTPDTSPPPPLPALAAFPRRGSGGKMMSGCGMRESGGGGWGRHR